MPQYQRSLDLYQGYNYKKDKQTPVGYITSLQIGTAALAADQTAKDPTNPTRDLAVVAVLSDVLWQTGVTDAVYLSGQVSTANRQGIASLLLADSTSIQVVFQFAVYDYDPLAKRYFLAFHGNRTDLLGILEKRGDELNLGVADEPSYEVQSPENYAFQIGIKPQPTAQALHLATACEKHIVKSWGLAVV